MAVKKASKKDVYFYKMGEYSTCSLALFSLPISTRDSCPRSVHLTCTPPNLNEFNSSVVSAKFLLTSLGVSHYFTHTRSPRRRGGKNFLYQTKTNLTIIFLYVCFSEVVVSFGSLEIPHSIQSSLSRNFHGLNFVRSGRSSLDFILVFQRYKKPVYLLLLLRFRR